MSNDQVERIPNGQTLEVAKQQRALIRFMLVGVPAILVLLSTPNLLAMAMASTIIIIACCLIHRVGVAVKGPGVSLWLMIPASLILPIFFLAGIFVAVNRRANKLLRERGVRVGFLGAKQEDMRRLIGTAGLCPSIEPR
jgi:hypothetical protein